MSSCAPRPPAALQPRRPTLPPAPPLTSAVPARASDPQVLLVLCVFFGVLILKLVISFLLPDVPASLRMAMAKEKWTTKELQGVLDKAEHAQLATPARKSDGGRPPSKLREAR